MVSAVRWAVMGAAEIWRSVAVTGNFCPPQGGVVLGVVVPPAVIVFPGDLPGLQLLGLLFIVLLLGLLDERIDLGRVVAITRCSRGEGEILDFLYGDGSHILCFLPR